MWSRDMGEEFRLDKKEYLSWRHFLMNSPYISTLKKVWMEFKNKDGFWLGD